MAGRIGCQPSPFGFVQQQKTTGRIVKEEAISYGLFPFEVDPPALHHVPRRAGEAADAMITNERSFFWNFERKSPGMRNILQVFWILKGLG